jgi:hypothetical protein
VSTPDPNVRMRSLLVIRVRAPDGDALSIERQAILFWFQCRSLILNLCFELFYKLSYYLFFDNSIRGVIYSDLEFVLLVF